MDQIELLKIRKPVTLFSSPNPQICSNPRTLIMSESSQLNDESYCKCLQRSIIVTSWTSENPGRRFRSCSEYEKMKDENKMLVLENERLQLKLQEVSSKMKDENKMLVLENKRLQLKLQEVSSKMKDEKKMLVLENKRLQLKLQRNSKTTFWFWLLVGVVSVYLYLFSKKQCLQHLFFFWLKVCQPPSQSWVTQPQNSHPHYQNQIAT
ncbi:GRF zinc finger containing protein [Striga asiatica]|uniref:GRF zinc finger containing protein n=1 Tax=Striga asiatica TaxID=4170 RepID=A0A5A7Q956_STRAF|nr:GRF zinc finger containing protein [Striga asiatica]